MLLEIADWFCRHKVTSKNKPLNSNEFIVIDWMYKNLMGIKDVPSEIKDYFKPGKVVNVDAFNKQFKESHNIYIQITSDALSKHIFDMRRYVDEYIELERKQSIVNSYNVVIANSEKNTVVDKCEMYKIAKTKMEASFQALGETDEHTYVLTFPKSNKVIDDVYYMYKFESDRDMYSASQCEKYIKKNGLKLVEK